MMLSRGLPLWPQRKVTRRASGSDGSDACKTWGLAEWPDSEYLASIRHVAFYLDNFECVPLINRNHALSSSP